MEYYKEIIVASIDVLGMGKLLESENGTMKSLNILNGIFKNTADPFMYLKPDFKGDKIRTFRETLKFGDSIYIISNPNDSIEEQTYKLIARTAGLIAIGIFFYEHKFFLRCGIAKGDLRDVTIGMPEYVPEYVKNITERFLIGNSMSRANYLEKNQRWIGGAIMGDIDCNKCMNYLLKYKIPLKKRIPEPYKPKYAINWLKFVIENGFDINQVDQEIDSISNFIGSNNRNDIKKIKNTKKFVKKVLRK